MIVWSRQALQLGDHRALTAAVEYRAPVLPVYVLDEVSPGRWVLELAGLSAPDIHKPCTLSADTLDTASHKLRKSYCNPNVDHRQARMRARDAYNSLRRNTQQ
ncbi:MAG: FAD-binding domain-containing protein [Hyphomicrobium sp.]